MVYRPILMPRVYLPAVSSPFTPGSLGWCRCILPPRSAGVAPWVALVSSPGRLPLASQDADALIEQMASDKDPVLRYGGQFAVGLAYAGTADNSAWRGRPAGV